MVTGAKHANISIYQFHALNTIAFIFRCIKKYSPETGVKYRLKSGESANRSSKPLAHKYILKYIIINIYINIREGMREERESYRKERERERK